MTSTTDRAVTPWPTRREREGGPARRARTATRAGTERPVIDPAVPAGRAAHTGPAGSAAGERPAAGRVADRPVAYVPRHAALDPDVTERMPIVVPAQRSAEVRPTPAPRPAPAPAPCPAPAPEAAQVPAAVAPAPPVGTPSAVPAHPPVVDPATAPAAPLVVGPAAGPPPGPWRPASTPRPPRPAVGSAVHEARPGRPMRNGLGLAAVCLGAIGLPLGLAPVTGFAAAGLGVLALVFGIAGWSRVRSGVASNRGAAVTGAVLGLVALGLGVAGTVAFVRAPDQPVYDLDALTGGSTAAVVVTPAGE